MNKNIKFVKNKSNQTQIRLDLFQISTLEAVKLRKNFRVVKRADKNDFISLIFSGITEMLHFSCNFLRKNVEENTEHRI